MTHTPPTILSTDKEYGSFLAAIKSRVSAARIRATRAVSRELLDLYWEIGRDIVDRQERLGWGKSVVERLSKDLKQEFPGTSGFSAQNLWLMRQFYMEYHEHTNLQQLAREIPWFSNVAIIGKVKDYPPRILPALHRRPRMEPQRPPPSNCRQRLRTAPADSQAA